MRHTSSLHQGDNNECGKKGVTQPWSEDDYGKIVWVALDGIWANLQSVMLKLRPEQLRGNELLWSREVSRDSTWRSYEVTQKKYFSWI